MYEWRKMTEDQRAQILRERRQRRFPWHSPPHWEYAGPITFLITAACYEHQPIIGKTPRRMEICESDLLKVCQDLNAKVLAWCILPNHYHLVVWTDQIEEIRRSLGLFHGRSSFRWNGEDSSRGRKVWCNFFERPMKSERHYWATLNYVHHNAVHHGYVRRWQDWPYSSASHFLDEVGPEKAKEIWLAYPILDYGKDWDV